jgi:UrcA family protein
MNKNSFFRNAVLCAGAMLVSLGAMAEAAESSVRIQTRIVKYDRAAATTAVGAEQLYSSLNQAVVRVCVDSAEPMMVQGRLYAQCRDAALDQAVGTVGIEAVSALHAQNSRAVGSRGTVTTGTLNQ